MKAYLELQETDQKQSQNFTSNCKFIVASLKYDVTLSKLDGNGKKMQKKPW